MLTIWRHWAQTEGAQQLALEDTGKVFKNKEHQKGTNRNNVPQWWRGGKSTYLRNEHSKFTEQRNHSIWEKTAEIAEIEEKKASKHKFGLAHRYHELAGWIPPGWQPKPSKLLPLLFHPPAAPHEAAGPPLDIEKKQTSTTGFAHLAAVHLAWHCLDIWKVQGLHGAVCIREMDETHVAISQRPFTVHRTRPKMWIPHFHMSYHRLHIFSALHIIFNCIFYPTGLFPIAQLHSIFSPALATYVATNAHWSHRPHLGKDAVQQGLEDVLFNTAFSELKMVKHSCAHTIAFLPPARQGVNRQCTAASLAFAALTFALLCS